MQIFSVLMLVLFLPLFSIFWLWKGGYQGRISWLGALVQATGVMVFLAVIGPVGWLGYGALLLMVGLLGVALVASWRKGWARPWLPEKGWATLLAGGMTGFVGLVFWAAGLFGLTGYSAPAGAVDLAWPFTEGAYLIGHGGANPLINFHNVHPSQTYALDLGKMNVLGARAWGLYPKDLDAYAIYDQPVVSPCAGTVVAAVDRLPDLVPPQRDRVNIAGNHIALDCGDAIVYLAHPRQGSVAVTVGDTVAVHSPLGRIGNSGNTTEPHLHIHAEAGPYADTFSGTPGVPIRFDGRFLVRNSIIWR